MYEAYNKIDVVAVHGFSKSRDLLHKFYVYISSGKMETKLIFHLVL